MGRLRTAIFALACASLGCSSTVIEEPSASGEPIIVAANLPLSGEFAAYGGVWRQAIELSVTQTNAAGGVDGRPLHVTFYDNRSDPVEAADVCDQIAMEGAPAMLGPGLSTSVTACLPAIAGGLVSLSGSSTAPTLAGDVDGGYLFRTVASDAQQAEVLAHHAVSIGIASVAIAQAPESYHLDLGDHLQAAFEARGIAVLTKVAIDAEPSVTWGDLTSAGAPQAIVFTGSAEALVSLAKAGSFSGSWLATSTAANASHAADLHAAAPALAIATQTHARNAAFDSFAEAFPHPPHDSFGPMYYDAAILLGLALDLQLSREASLGGSGLATALFEVAAPPGPRYGPAKLAEALAAEAVDYDGASGPNDFDAQGEVKGPFSILRPDPGGLSEVAVIEPGEL